MTDPLKGGSYKPTNNQVLGNKKINIEHAVDEFFNYYRWILENSSNE